MEIRQLEAFNAVVTSGNVTAAGRMLGRSQPVVSRQISDLEADFSPEPAIGREVGFKTLKLSGKYPTSPNVTKFELNYIPEGKEWKLSKIEVDTTQKK